MEKLFQIENYVTTERRCEIFLPTNVGEVNKVKIKCSRNFLQEKKIANKKN